MMLFGIYSRSLAFSGCQRQIPENCFTFCSESGLDLNSKVQKSNVVLAANVSHDVLVEEFENKRDTVGEYQMLGHELKLINVVDLEVFQEEEEDGRHSFHNDFFVSVNINSKLHRLHHCHWHLFRQHICHDIDGVCLGLAGGSSSKKNLKESNHILWQGWQHGLVQHLLAK